MGRSRPSRITPVMGAEPGLDDVAHRYVTNVRNRGIFDRVAYYANWAGSPDGGEDVPVAFVLGEDFKRYAEEELAEIAPKWERFISSPSRILDAGSGPGVTTRAMARRYPDATVVGIDVEDPALDLAGALNADIGDRCEFRSIPVEELRDEE